MQAKDSRLAKGQSSLLGMSLGARWPSLGGKPPAYLQVSFPVQAAVTHSAYVAQGQGDSESTQLWLQTLSFQKAALTTGPHIPFPPIYRAPALRTRMSCEHTLPTLPVVPRPCSAGTHGCHPGQPPRPLHLKECTLPLAFPWP